MPADETPPPVCDHDAHCPTCNLCAECYPHEPGTWAESGVTEPCRSAGILAHLNKLDALEAIAADISQRAANPRHAGQAGSMLDRIRGDRDRILGTDGL